MRQIYNILSLSFVFLLSACSNWLDVTPSGESEAKYMFTTELGYMQALTGSYLLLADPSIYGKELLVGVTEEIVQNWSNQTAFKDFNYEDAAAVSRLNGIWAKMYEAIANTNLVIDNIDKADKSMFSNYDLIRGEAYGLRAYLHLDMLRLFGPVLKFGVDQKAIPYHERFDNKIVQLMTAKEVLDKIKRDLEIAYNCLKNDPVNTYGRRITTPIENNKDLAFNYRGIRMNYYAVSATLARYHILAGEKSEALKYAKEVIDSELFKLTTQAQAVNREDYLFQSELIWAPFDQEMQTHLSRYFTPSGGTGTSFITANEDYKKWVYEGTHAHGSSRDFRSSLYWGRTTTGQGMVCYMNRYMRRYDATNSDITKWDKVIPLVRVTEMYYIAAEALIGVDNEEALKLLNAVRQSREVQALPDTYATDDNALLEQIVYEYQKDTYGEGKMFFLYKRLFRDIITNTNRFVASQKMFELPIPVSEIEAGGN